MIPEPELRPQRVLVVDDNAQNRLVVEGNLAAAGYAVSMAESGEQALQMFEREAPDLVLLDLLMPGMDGFETCAKLRALPGGADTPIVFLTALSDVETHERAMQSGADDFLTKPIRRVELLIRVKSLLRLKRLTDEVRRGYEVIRQQRDALLRAQEQKEQLTALVVHDLKNPLSGIVLNARFLARDPVLSGDHRAAAQNVLSAAQSMHRMVLNLLDISRSEDGVLTPRRASVSLAALLDEVCSAARVRATEQRQELAVRVESGALAAIDADADLLRRVLENLVDNALRHSPDGGAISLEVAPRADGAPGVELRVRDEGHGVPAGFREKIFDKYVQLESPGDGASVRSGRGLGLVFCRLAAEAHGGRIWVEENRPRGSVFCVMLPASVAAPSSAPAPASAAPASA